jgi:hypothetical protein
VRPIEDVAGIGRPHLHRKHRKAPLWTGASGRMPAMRRQTGVGLGSDGYVVTHDPPLPQPQRLRHHEEANNVGGLDWIHERPDTARPQVRLDTHIQKERCRRVHQCAGSACRRFLTSS